MFLYLSLFLHLSFWFIFLCTPLLLLFHLNFLKLASIPFGYQGTDCVNPWSRIMFFERSHQSICMWLYVLQAKARWKSRAAHPREEGSKLNRIPWACPTSEGGAWVVLLQPHLLKLRLATSLRRDGAETLYGVPNVISSSHFWLIWIRSILPNSRNCKRRQE